MDYNAALRSGVDEIFQTMVMMEVRAGGSAGDVRYAPDGPSVTSMIGLGGDIKGMMAIHAPEAVALAVTGSMLGMDIAELDDDVKDAFAEIANMVAGHLKVVCAEHDVKIQIAIPNSVVGQSFHISGFKGACRVSELFETEHGPLFVELKFVEA